MAFRNRLICTLVFSKSSLPFCIGMLPLLLQCEPRKVFSGFRRTFEGERCRGKGSFTDNTGGEKFPAVVIASARLLFCTLDDLGRFRLFPQQGLLEETFPDGQASRAAWGTAAVKTALPV